MNPTVWEVDARVLEPGDSFMVFVDNPCWFRVIRTRQVEYFFFGIPTQCTELLYEYVDWFNYGSRYVVLESGRKVVVPVLPKSL